MKKRGLLLALLAIKIKGVRDLASIFWGLRQTEAVKLVNQLDEMFNITTHKDLGMGGLPKKSEVQECLNSLSTEIFKLLDLGFSPKPKEYPEDQGKEVFFEYIRETETMFWLLLKHKDQMFKPE